MLPCTSGTFAPAGPSGRQPAKPAVQSRAWRAASGGAGRKAGRRSRQQVHVAAVAAEPAPASKQRGRPRKTDSKQKRLEDVSDMEIMERGMNELPRPTQFQQTLTKSFTLGGVGLHTGEYAHIRVRPAFAGEGRYFVRVPEGTNCHLFKLQDDETEVDVEELDGETNAPDPELEKLKVVLFQQYLRAQEDEAFPGTFAQYVQRLDALPTGEQVDPELREALVAGTQERMQALLLAENEVEEPVERSEEDAALSAIIHNVTCVGQPFLQLGLEPQAVAVQAELPGNDIVDGDLVEVGPSGASDPAAATTVHSPKYAGVSEDGLEWMTPEEKALGRSGGLCFKNVGPLLSALEACGIDNCRIELEGGNEVPVLDGSSLGWVLNIQQAGVRVAPLPPSFEHDEPLEANEALAVRKFVMAPPTVVSVSEGESFITYYPTMNMKLTAGIDVQETAPIIGQQWYSWCPATDYHYRYELAPARLWASSMDDLLFWRSNGFLKAGSEGCFIIGYGDRWWDPQIVRFHDDEPSRQVLVDLIGACSLLGFQGNMGVPAGHVVAYNASHDMMVQWARAMVKATVSPDNDEEGHWLPVEYEQPEADQAEVVPENRLPDSA